MIIEDNDTESHSEIDVEPEVKNTDESLEDPTNQECLPLKKDEPLILTGK